MTTPKTIAAENTRALAAEKALSDRITALEKPAVPPPIGTLAPAPTLQAVAASAADGATVVAGTGVHPITALTTLHAITIVPQDAANRPRLDITRNGLWCVKGGTSVSGLRLASLIGQAGVTDGNGSANLEVDGQTPIVGGVLLDALDSTLDPTANGGQHGIYLRGVFDLVHVRGYTSNGNGSTGTGLHAYHVNVVGGVMQYATELLIEGATFTGHHNYAVQLWLPIRKVTFRDCKFIDGQNIDLLTGGDVIFDHTLGHNPYRRPSTEGLPVTASITDINGSDRTWRGVA